MAIDKSTLDSYLEAAVTAVGAGSWASAKAALMQADIVLAGMPDYSIGTRRVAYRQQIDAMTKRIDEMAAQTTAARKNERVFAKYSRE